MHRLRTPFAHLLFDMTEFEKKVKFYKNFKTYIPKNNAGNEVTGCFGWLRNEYRTQIV